MPSGIHVDVLIASADDVVAPINPDDDGKVLAYNASTEKYEHVTMTGGGGGFTLEQFWTYAERTLTRFGRLTGVEFTYTVTSSANGLPIPSVAVWFAADGGGTQIVWSGHTDALGIARDAYGALPRLDPGTYYVFRSRPGYVFRNPDTEIINE